LLVLTTKTKLDLGKAVIEILFKKTYSDGKVYTQTTSANLGELLSSIDATSQQRKIRARNYGVEARESDPPSSNLALESFMNFKVIYFNRFSMLYFCLPNVCLPLKYFCFKHIVRFLVAALEEFITVRLFLL